jgi:RNA polymerase sigma-32 factor
MATKRKAARPAKKKAAPPAKAEGAEGSDAEAGSALEPEVLLEDAEAGLSPEDDAAEPRDADAASSTLPVPVERDLSRADALQRYMAEVARHPLLTREQEHELAAKFVETRDPMLAYRMVTANLRLVVKIANEYRRAAFSLLDLIQEGNVGLMQAVQKYDPFRGVKLSSYAAWWIRAYIIRYLMDNWRMVKLGTTQAQRKLFFNLRKEQERLISQGFEAAPALLAQTLDVSEQDINEMDQRLGNDELSLDAPVHGSGGEESRQTHGDRLTESARPADEQLADEELRRIFKEKLAAFGATLTSEKDKFLFENRISSEEPMTLQQVGTKYGFTRERARQLEARLTERLREYLRAELPDFAQLSVNPTEEE